MLLITATDKWRGMYPGARFGLLEISGVAPLTTSAQVDEQKRAVEQCLRERYHGFSRPDFLALPVMAAYSRYYKRFSKTYHVLLQLESIVLKSRDLPNVSALVDSNFMAEVDTLVLTAGHDVGKLQVPILMDVANESDQIVQMNGATRLVLVDDMVMRDAHGVCCSIIYGQDNLSPISPVTSHVLYVSYAPADVPAELVMTHLQKIKENIFLFSPDVVVEQQLLLQQQFLSWQEVITMFDLSTTPFSRYGSYVAFSHLSEDVSHSAGLYLRSVRGPGLTAWQTVFQLELLKDGQPVHFSESVSPSLLRLDCEFGFAEICLARPDVIRMRCQGVALRLSRAASGYDYLIRKPGGLWQITICAEFEARYMLASLAGELAVVSGWDGVRSQGMAIELTHQSSAQIAEFELREFRTSWAPTACPETFKECVRLVESEFESWKDSLPPVPGYFSQASDLAAYLTWSCVVMPAGLLTRPAMFMSKNNMASIWSWDNCFNALALAQANPCLAWDQLMVMVDQQAEDGSLPDLMNDMIISRSFVKPPVYGWAIQRMWQMGSLTIERMREIYKPLCRNTDWWVKDDDGIPAYDHGNDSGWDNSTIFATLPPVESPDLCAYLVLQMETLAKIAQALNLNGDAAGWQKRADQLLCTMLRRFWREDHFVAIQSVGQVEIESESLILYMPLLLGRRLPGNVIQALVRGLRADNRFLTPYGLATESIASPAYQPDGYWRGPIWGAPLIFLIEGLSAVGELEFARDLALRFCNLCATSGMAENYNALSGAPLRDRAFTWTSSHFFLAAAELLKE